MKTLEAIDRFMFTRRGRRLSEHTISNYEYTLAKLAKMYPQLPTSANDIYALFNAHEHLADASIHGMWQKLKTFFIWVEHEGFGRNIMDSLPAPRVRKRLRRILTDAECDRLLQNCYTERDYAMVVVLLDTGMRAGELASLRHENFLFDGVIVNGKTGERLVPLSPGVRAMLEEQGDRDVVWVGRDGAMNASGISRAVKRVMKRAGIQPPKLGPHALRHTFAVRYLTAGGDFASLQKILGHSKVETTMIYGEMTIDLLLRQHRKFSPMAHFSIEDMKLADFQEGSIRNGSSGGVKSGAARRKKATARNRRIMRMIDEGMKPTDIARKVGVDRHTVWKVRKSQEMQPAE